MSILRSILGKDKAFDRLSHSCLKKMKTQTKCSFRWHFRPLMEILYRNLRSKVLINHTFSSAFQLTRSARQGCPHSSLIYVLALKPLRENKTETTPTSKAQLYLKGKASANWLPIQTTQLFPPQTTDPFETYSTISHFFLVRGVGQKKSTYTNHRYR